MFNSSAAGDWVNCGICGEWAHFGCDRRQGLGAFKVLHHHLQLYMKSFDVLSNAKQCNILRIPFFSFITSAGLCKNRWAGIYMSSL